MSLSKKYLLLLLSLNKYSLILNISQLKDWVYISLIWKEQTFLESITPEPPSHTSFSRAHAQHAEALTSILAPKEKTYTQSLFHASPEPLWVGLHYYITLMLP